MKTKARKAQEMIYEVQAILDESVMSCQPHYLIKWKNLGHQYDTWEPVQNLRNIREYLKFWITQRKLKNQKHKVAREKNYKSIKPYLYSGEFLSKRKSGKYAEQILSRKKIWDEYIQREEKATKREKKIAKDDQVVINIDDEQTADERDSSKVNKELTSSVLNEPPQESQKEKHFKVVGSINLKNIKRIVRMFTWKGTQCLQIEMTNNQFFNIKVSEIRKSAPLMFLQFCEDNKIKI